MEEIKKDEEIQVLSEKNKNKLKEEREEIEPITKYFVLISLCFISSFMGISGSVISSNALRIKQDLTLTDKQFGSLGTFVGAGNSFGSFLYILSNNKISLKNLFLLSTAISTCSHLFFFITNNYYLLSFIRFISGTSQVMGYCYFPVWMDQFNEPKYKTLVYTIMNLCGTIGGIWGYLIRIYISSEKWRFELMIETISIMIFVFILLFVPGKYFNIKQNIKNMKIFKDKLNNSKKQLSEIKKENPIKKLLNNITFMSICFYEALEYLIAGAQFYWFSDYITEVFMEKNPTKIFYSFTFSIIVTRVIGKIFGGFIGTTIIGDAGSHKNLIAMILFHFFCCLSAIIAPNMGTLILFTVFNGLYHFFKSIILLLCVPYLFSLVNKSLKGSAAGLHGLLNSVFGNLPAPYVYGAIKTYYKSGKKAMKIVLYCNCIGFLFLIIADISRRYREKNLKKGII